MAQKKDQYLNELKYMSLKSFRDKPDAIKQIRCVECHSDKMVIEWDAPNDNNCAITVYKVYLSDKVVSRDVTKDWSKDTDDIKSSELK